MLLRQLAALTALVAAPRIEILFIFFIARIDEDQIVLPACFDVPDSPLDPLGCLNEKWSSAEWQVLII